MTKDLIRMNYKEMNTLDEGLTEHFHQGYEIIFITEGKARFIVNDEPGIYSKNSVVFINNLVKHRMSLEQVPYSRYMIIIDSSFFNDFIQIPEIHLLFKSKQQNFQNGVLIEPEDMAYVKDKIVHLQNIYDQKKHYWKYEFIANLFSLLIFIIREYPQNFPTQTIDRNTLLMIRIQQFIDSHFRSDITLEKLADEFFMSKYHLIKSFQDVTGYTVKQYILLKRIDFSIHQLLNTSRPITEIALDSGFNSSSNFTRMFKKKTGHTPLEYRKIFGT